MNIFLTMQRVGIFVLLFLMLFLPMMHLHPASAHTHEIVTEVVVHADFFPNAVHAPKSSKKNVGDRGASIEFSHERLSEVDLLSPHIAQSFQFSSIFKRKPATLVQVSFERSLFLYFQRGVLMPQHAPPLEASQFSSPSLRAPPYFS